MGKSMHTPGPWAWFGNASSTSLYLATTHSGRRFVMDFARWGMRGAQPRFQVQSGVMTPARDLLMFEVGDSKVVGYDAATEDTSVYRYDVRGIASADARLIAAAPDMFDALAEAKEAISYAMRGTADAEQSDRYAATIARIDEALTKAEGRS